jgi:2-polyprenyl-3-methyl-5-hydroxy-6-metoxy-1,4-benzoquinol methylase
MGRGASRFGLARFEASGMPDRAWWAALRPDPTTTLRTMGVLPGMSVLDLCCGDGYFTAALCMLTRATVTALDLDRELLERARAEVARSGAPSPTWIEGDAMAVESLLHSRVDYVLVANTFHGVSDKVALAMRIASILKPGGRLGILNWHGRPREETCVLGEPRGPKTELRMTPDAARAVVAPSGLVIERTVEIPPFHYAAVFLKP